MEKLHMLEDVLKDEITHFVELNQAKVREIIRQRQSSKLSWFA